MAIFLVDTAIALTAFLDWIGLMFDSRPMTASILENEAGPTFMRFVIGGVVLVSGSFIWTAFERPHGTGNTSVFQGPVGIAGGAVHVSDATIDQRQDIDLADLAEDLAKLRSALAKESLVTDAAKALGHVVAAEQSARAGDGKRTESELRRARRVALDVAMKIGIAIATAALKRSFGRLTGADRRYRGGTENAIILVTLSREMLKCRAVSRWLIHQHRQVELSDTNPQ